ncbi:hypothetical protein [Yoonia sp.]|uniref:hypothetical protein n=1 Tax=Yoonia sp. TaxID=2212373 RepID=UPI003A4DBE73
MFRTVLVCAAAVTLAANAVQAQGFSGATLGIDYTKSLENADLGGVNYYGQAEVEAVAGISFALDLTFYDFIIAGGDAQNVTGHAIYALDNQISVGAYFGRDWIDGDTINTYGVQGAYVYGAGIAQGYIGLGDGVYDDILLIGAAGNYGFGGGISAVGSLDRVGFDGGHGLSLEVGGEYALMNGPTFTGVLGRVSTDDNDELYIGIKARIDLGHQGGTTFDRRGFFEAYRAPSL